MWLSKVVGVYDVDTVKALAVQLETLSKKVDEIFVIQQKAPVM